MFYNVDKIVVSIAVRAIAVVSRSVVLSVDVFVVVLSIIGFDFLAQSMPRQLSCGICSSVFVALLFGSLCQFSLQALFQTMSQSLQLSLSESSIQSSFQSLF